MEEVAHYETARRRAKAKYGFYVHAAVYVAVMLMLMAINISTSPGRLWFIWPLVGWGLAVALHGARVFLMSDRDKIIDAMTEQELHRSDTDRRGD
jgi:hypothetical protein